MLEHEISESVESIFRLNDKNKYNISLGFFQGYSSEAVDASGTRFADIKLHYRDDNGDEISALSVPIMFQGNQNTVDDFALTKGDELIVLFSDRSLEQWNQLLATSPQALTNRVKDSLNHALCIPINTHHSFSLIAPTAIDSSVGRRVLVKAGKKIQIGNDVVDLLKLFDRFLGIFAGDFGPWDATGSSSTGTVSVPASVAEIASIRAALGLIAKV